MKNGIRKFINFYLYSSIHISIAATIFTFESFLFLNTDINYSYLGFVFCATLLTYSLHRIVGIRKLDHNVIDSRFRVIKQYETHIIIYTVLSVLATIYFLCQLDSKIIFLLIIPAIISGLYTIPILSKNKRLRDFNFIKIILIAFVWAVIALIGPSLDSNASKFILLLLFIEKAFYIFCITLPFDIRDLKIDKYLNVKTFPFKWGTPKTYLIINIGFLASMLLTILVLNLLTELTAVSLLLVIAAYAINIFAVQLSKGKTSDFYYSGLLDGVIIIRSLLLISIFYL